MTGLTATQSGLASDSATWGGTAFSKAAADGYTVACGAYNICWDVDCSPTGLNFVTGMTVTGTGMHFFPTQVNLTYPPSATVATTLTGGVLATATTLHVKSGTGFANGAAVNLIDPSTGNRESVVISSGGTTTTLTVSATKLPYSAANTIVTLSAIPAFAGSTTPSKYPGTATPPYLLLAAATSLSPTTLYVGNSTTDYVVRPAAAATQMPLTIALQTTGTIAATYQGNGSGGYFGWVAPLEFTTLAANCNTSDTVMWLTADLGLQQGDQVVIGNGSKNGVMTESNMGLYTVSAYVTNDGGATPYKLTLTAGLQATDGARKSGDYVAIYSRPIVIKKAAYGAGSNSVAYGMMQGVLVYQMALTAGAYWTFVGLTYAPNNSACTLMSNQGTFTSCLLHYPATSQALTAYSYCDTFTNCIGFNTNVGFANGGTTALYVGCVIQNQTHGFVTTSNAIRMINCVGLNSANETLTNFSSNIVLIGCHAGGGVTGDLNNPMDAELYNCTLASATPVSSFLATTGARPNWGNIQARSCTLAGTLYTMYAWGKGGRAMTQSTTTYNNTETLKMIIDTGNYPIYWNWKTYAPPNKTITFPITVTKDIAGGTFRLQIIDPYADPLWGLGNAVLAEVNMDAAYSASMATPAWSNYSVSYTSTKNDGQPVILRLTFQNTGMVGNAYAYLRGLEQAFKKKRVLQL